MEHFSMPLKGVCSVKVDFDMEDGLLHNVKFTGGCDGNLKAIGRLVEGKKATEIADILRGNKCDDYCQLSCVIPVWSRA